MGSQKVEDQVIKANFDQFDINPTDDDKDKIDLVNAEPPSIQSP